MIESNDPFGTSLMNRFALEFQRYGGTPELLDFMLGEGFILSQLIHDAKRALERKQLFVEMDVIHLMPYKHPNGLARLFVENAGIDGVLFGRFSNELEASGLIDKPWHETSIGYMHHWKLKIAGSNKTVRSHFSRKHSQLGHIWQLLHSFGGGRVHLLSTTHMNVFRVQAPDYTTYEITLIRSREGRWCMGFADKEYLNNEREWPAGTEFFEVGTT